MKKRGSAVGNNEEKMARALSERTGRVVHLTHNDLDAVGADAIHRIAFGDVFTIYSSVARFAPNLMTLASLPGRGDLLSISDIGYQEGVIDTLVSAKKNGWRIEWRDHHRWEESDVEAVAAVVDYLKVDTTTCACGIVARDLLPGESRAEAIARIVCDYDLWHNEDPRSAILGRLASVRRYRELVREALISGEFINRTISNANAGIEAEMKRAIEESIRHATCRNGKLRIVFAPLYGYPSETAAAIRERFGSDIEVLVNPNGRFSIRSVPPVSHIIARRFGGGGHPNAAGGQFPFTILDRFLFWLTKNSRFYRTLEHIAASTV
ncbi:MAG: DHH family phosphoesterase [Methanoculleaceae archaeon]